MAHGYYIGNLSSRGRTGQLWKTTMLYLHWVVEFKLVTLWRKQRGGRFWDSGGSANIQTMDHEAGMEMVGREGWRVALCSKKEEP